MNPITRWWRSKGHGIHSPFAFRMVTGVLPERGRYYAYDDIEQLPESGRLKLLFRVVCELEPSTVYGLFMPDMEKAVILMADSRVRFVDDPENADLFVGALPRELHEGKSALFWSAGPAWKEFRSRLTGGMTFSNGRVGLAVNRHGLPRQDFESAF